MTFDLISLKEYAELSDLERMKYNRVLDKLSNLYYEVYKEEINLVESYEKNIELK